MQNNKTMINYVITLYYNNLNRKKIFKMKQLFLALFLIFGLTISNLSAQCKHSAAATEKSCSKTASVSEAALKAAAADATIEKKVCEKSGCVSFQRKSVDANGTASYTAVQYDEAKAMFVDMPTEAKSEVKACCKAGASKSCCKGKGKSCSKGTASVETPAAPKSE